MDFVEVTGRLAALKRLRGMVVLCGYATPLYDRALRRWHRYECDALADGARPRTEVVWINPACHRQLEADRAGGHQLDIFQRAVAT